jgi:hypothetical protein
MRRVTIDGARTGGETPPHQPRWWALYTILIAIAVTGTILHAMTARTPALVTTVDAASVLALLGAMAVWMRAHRALRRDGRGGMSPRASVADADLVEAMHCRLRTGRWAPRRLFHVVARHGVIELDGLVHTNEERATLVAMARSIPGCVDVEDRLVVQSEGLTKAPWLSRRI